MKDQELLRLAVKATGMRVLWSIDGYPALSLTQLWNPLEDDGDALRLAAQLKIDIEWQSTQVGAYPNVEAYISNPDGACFCADEPEENYRRAIVRAAAELGKEMP